MFEGLNWRKLKKIDRFIVGDVQEAYYLGEEAGNKRKPKRNPYPAGRRHNEWERGYSLSEKDARHG